MKILREFFIIASATCAGELLHHVLPFPVPAGIYGMVLLLVLLLPGRVREEQIAKTADYLIEVMPLMFIPAAVGLVDVFGQLKRILLPVCVMTFVSTFLVMGVTGKVEELLLKGKESKAEKEEKA